MKNKLMQKLNEISENAYDFLKLSSVVVSKKEKKADITFIYTDEFTERIKTEKDALTDLIKKIISSRLTLNIIFVKSCFFANVFIDELVSYLEIYPSVRLNITYDNISIESYGDGFHITIFLPQSIVEYAKNAGILQKIEEYFSFRYCSPLNFEIQEKKSVEKLTQNIDSYIKKAEYETPQLESEGGRVIIVSDKILVVGGFIEGNSASYISDARITEKAIHCGIIDELAIIPMKPKPPAETTDKKFYKFKVKDFTGTITCLYFPAQKSEKELNELCDGKAVLLAGRVTEDNYDKSKLCFMVRKIMFCTLPLSFSENRMIRKVADEYLTVEPKTYVNPIQSSLFDIKEKPPAMLSGKRYCVFDLETTGLDPKNNEIMEIGAAIIEDGEIKETFSSFVSIKNPVPQKITQLTGIDDSHLEGQPQLKDVLADFYKFSNGMPLVGQNVGFDYGFISEHGAKHHMYFDNERIDTIVLARKYLKNMKNFTLKSITAKLDIANDEAHRALSDAIATAKVFIKLAKLAE